jgi:phosphoglucomutase
MAAGLKAEGKTLEDRLNELRIEFGYYAQRLLTFEYEGIAGARRMEEIMKQLRGPLSGFADTGLKISDRIDYLYDSTGLPASDVLEFHISEGCKFVVRPSGTEPKLKAYLFAHGQNQSAAEASLDILEKSVRSLCE